MDFLTERLARNPHLHVFHFGAYESTALGRLMGRHATREDEVDRLLRGRVDGLLDLPDRRLGMFDLLQMEREQEPVVVDDDAMEAREQPLARRLQPPGGVGEQSVGSRLAGNHRPEDRATTGPKRCEMMPVSLR